MIVKYIKCDVKATAMDWFSKGQECWQQTALSDGFMVQTGGWDKTQAVILALWDNMDSVQAFMQGAHDPIAAQASQQDHYLQLRVEYFNPLEYVAGRQVSNTSPAVSVTHLANAITQAIAFQTFQYSVPVINQAQWVSQQQRHWQHVAANFTGFLGWQLMQSNKRSEQLLVISTWASFSEQQYYQTHSCSLTLTSEQRLFDSINSHSVKVTPQWRVTADSLLPNIETC
ncbi:DUF4937 domain-containing protein [Shewanella youngdeokensis]|uniref:DUF4937 domain-containing protein n=1 Tax=Shewanella youngdeokensis TaxID=2999068 RepID=A0ABZ0JZG1_9GAMM|nr:DUF4937 domain-containing protein [Shewanella sp. DAU334]